MSELEDLVPLPHIWERMEKVEERLFAVSTSEDSYLTQIAQHLLAAGGKRYRPLLALLASELGPAPDGRPIEAGVAVELIHVGSLYHDDVIDEADTRRGATSANTNWTNTVAILAGDFLMARASESAATHLSQESVRLLAATYAELVEGQTRELMLDYDTSHGVVEYEQVIYLKTASLIRTSARLGAIAADANPATVEAISNWATEVGMVFQIADDALDLVSSSDYLGKPVGSDIREGKFTLPVLLAMRGSSGSRIRSLLEQRPYTDAAIEEIIELVRSGGNVRASLDAASVRLEKAHSHLTSLPSGPIRDVLDSLAAYLVDRVAAVKD